MNFVYVTRLYHLPKIVALAFMLSTQPVAAQEFIGMGPINKNTEIFLYRDEVTELEDGTFLVMYLSVGSVTQRGIDLPSANGELYYDTRYPYRSRLTFRIYDCMRRMSGELWTLYYSGVRPDKNELVYKYTVNDPFLQPVHDYYDQPVYDSVC